MRAVLKPRPWTNLFPFSQIIVQENRGAGEAGEAGESDSNGSLLDARLRLQFPKRSWEDRASRVPGMRNRLFGEGVKSPARLKSASLVPRAARERAAGQMSILRLDRTVLTSVENTAMPPARSRARGKTTWPRRRPPNASPGVPQNKISQSPLGGKSWLPLQPGVLIFATPSRT